MVAWALSINPAGPLFLAGLALIATLMTLRNLIGHFLTLKLLVFETTKLNAPFFPNSRFSNRSNSRVLFLAPFLTNTPTDRPSRVYPDRYGNRYLYFSRLRTPRINISTNCKVGSVKLFATHRYFLFFEPR